MFKLATTVILLILSNIVMSFAWYGFLRKPEEESPLAMWKIVLISWGIAFFEYCLMIPANHLGRSVGLTLAQLKIMQEVITLSVFVPFMILYIGDEWKWDYLWAFLCILGAVFFVNREALMMN